MERLNEDDDLPFGGYRKGGGLDPRGLAKMLRAFEIRPRDVRLGEVKAKGYKSEWFTDAWERYCGEKLPGSDDLSATKATSALQSQESPIPDPRQTPDVADEETTANPHSNADVADVSDRNGQTGDSHVDEPIVEALSARLGAKS